MRGRKPPIAFQGKIAAVELDCVSKAAWIDVAVMLLWVIHENDPSVDLSDETQLAGLLFAYARPILKARRDRDPLGEMFFDSGIMAVAEAFDAPAWDMEGGRG